MRYPTSKKPTDPTFSEEWSGVTGAPKCRGGKCDRCGKATVHHEADEHYCTWCDDYVPVTGCRA